MVSDELNLKEGEPLHVSLGTRALPLDIIYDLLPFLDTRELFTLMRTCKALRNRGTKHILRRNIPVRRIEPFELFMAADKSRYRYLQHLTYLPRQKAVMDATKLLSVISLADCLYSLELRCDISDLGDMMKTKLFNAVAHILSLRHLRLMLRSTSHLGDRALLLRLSPCLTSLQLSFDTISDPIPFMSPELLQNLETLSFEHACFPPLQTALHRLRSLTLHECTMRTGTLISSFPNLRDLCLSTGYADAFSQRGVSVFRSVNATDQDTCKWPSLDTLSGTMIVLYMHAVTAPVRALHVDLTESDLEFNNRLHAVLQETRPKSLSIALSYCSADSTSHLLDGVETLIPRTARIKHLSLRVMWRSCESADDTQVAGRFVDALHEMISQLRLTTLRLDITKLIIPRSQPLQDHFELNAYETALRVVQQTTTLHRIMVHYRVQSMQPSRRRYWTVIRSSGDWELLELDPGVGEEVLGEDPVSGQ